MGDISDYWGTEDWSSIPDSSAGPTMNLPDTIIADAPAPDSSGWSWGNLSSSISKGANDLLGMWGTVQKVNQQGRQIDLTAQVQGAAARSQANAQLAGYRVADARTASTESIELARAQAVARNGGQSTAASLISKYGLPLALVVGGLIAYKKFAK